MPQQPAFRANESVCPLGEPTAMHTTHPALNSVFENYIHRVTQIQMYAKHVCAHETACVCAYTPKHTLSLARVHKNIKFIYAGSHTEPYSFIARRRLTDIVMRLPKQEDTHTHAHKDGRAPKNRRAARVNAWLCGTRVEYERDTGYVECVCMALCLDWSNANWTKSALCGCGRGRRGLGSDE